MSETEVTNVETRAVIHATCEDIQVRRGNDDAGNAGIWLKPDKLDGDGEFRLMVADLGAALKALGINRADVFPEG